MRALSRLFGLLLLGLLGGLVLLSSCETARTSKANDEAKQMQDLSNAAGASLLGIAGSRQVMRLDHQGEVQYKIPQSAVAAALIRQLHDGTVIDQVQVRAAPGSDAKQPVYYLIGLGHRNGGFRAIAIPLHGTDDSTYYLIPTAGRYIITGVGCRTCYFDFEAGHIIGTTCEDNSGGSSCSLQVLNANQVFTGSRPAAPPQKKRR
ncbi:hypothetical protein [Hymenobacter psoromatis]|uniref:hypothetical protein n=1 Tax=Hymenobacter psoromatis TaxID=1484116 RepID=UPI001CBFA4F1|nr:hypothetical protein [Hymenobacter psoromatis]